MGKVAVEAARRLRGKHRPEFTPNIDLGDHVVIVNASDVSLSGRKPEQKFWHRHTNRPGSLKSVSYADLKKDRPEKLVELAVRRMLPKNKLGRRLFTKLKVYAGGEHPHVAQKPRKVSLR